MWLSHFIYSQNVRLFIYKRGFVFGVVVYFSGFFLASRNEHKLFEPLIGNIFSICIYKLNFCAHDYSP